MSYLSRRCREIREEEERAPELQAAIDYGFPKAMLMIDPAMVRMQEEALLVYESTLRARNPMGYLSGVNFRGRGA